MKQVNDDTGEDYKMHKPRKLMKVKNPANSFLTLNGKLKRDEKMNASKRTSFCSMKE